MDKLLANMILDISEKINKNENIEKVTWYALADMLEEEGYSALEINRARKCGPYIYGWMVNDAKRELKKKIEIPEIIRIGYTPNGFYCADINVNNTGDIYLRQNGYWVRGALAYPNSSRYTYNNNPTTGYYSSVKQIENLLQKLYSKKKLNINYSTCQILIGGVNIDHSNKVIKLEPYFDNTDY